MKGTILTITAASVETVRQVKGEPTLELLKAGIGGGSIEVVPYFQEVRWTDGVHSCVAFCDEEGKLHGQPMNENATIRWQTSLLRKGRSLYGPDNSLIDYLVGQIAIVWGDREFMEAL